LPCNQTAPLAQIDAEEAERKADDLYRTLMKVGKELEKAGDSRAIPRKAASTIVAEIKMFLEEHIPLMLLLCTPGLHERHWVEIMNVTGLEIEVHDGTNLSQMLDISLHNYVNAIEDTCVAASKEYGLEKAMDKMETEWESMQFDTKPHRNTGTSILCAIDEIQQLLDDHIVKTQAMRGNRYITPFLDRITAWEKLLTGLQDIIDNWLKMQATWLYLEPIFSSEDIMRQMPTEGKLFRSVDTTYRDSMAHTVLDPLVLHVARREGLLDSLLEANRKLEQVQKGLNDYLETKRLAFPRFFFLSNDELLEILAETKDPLRVQPHLKKCFDGISALEFQANLDITACLDPGNERVPFCYEKVNHKMINPNESGGNVERWLIEVEAMMRKSVAYSVDLSMADYFSKDRLDWVQNWQGQVVLVINQAIWSRDVEAAIRAGAELGPGKGLKRYYEKQCTELLRTVELVRGKISKNLRTALGALVVLDVHNRDTVQEMTELKVANVGDFDWLAQLRYYWLGDNVSAQTGKPGTIECKMINAMQLYAYEYLGNNGRLVITPLTDRCYRTLMGAINLNLGGAPEGPAGTGKTETTKDLGKAIAIQCVVTNCSDGLDYLAMGKFFKGLASTGAWACFDEFNRIQLEVLSVVAQQVLCIQQAKARKLAKFVFEGTELPLNPTCCPFITMNPGYAGRAELPDNLKALFRTVAMMVPDYAMISEIILYSFGYTSAKNLAVKIVTTYKLCSEQLSSQSHYDYGMRAVMAVLRAAGNLKRSDGHLPEDVLVLRSILDVNLPKFLSPDVPLFNGIASDLFPGVTVDPPDRNAMKEAFVHNCHSMELQPVDYFWDKVVQIYDMMVVRHGFMIVGMPFSGKTSSWKVLAATLGTLKERFPNDHRWSKVIPFVMNPKSITMGQLYGQFDPVSHEWTDGVLAIQYRNAAANKVGTPEDRKWILFDGPVDAIWIENMNTVLDDNKKLCLMSGEIIAMTDVMSMMFEPMDLLVASPATVSRCGMVYLEPEQLGWKPLLTSWLEHFTKPLPINDTTIAGPTFRFTPEEASLIEVLFAWLIDPCLAFLRRELVEMAPSVDTNLVQSCINILECLLDMTLSVKIVNRRASEVAAEMVDIKVKKSRQQHIECSFIFALIWSVGCTGTGDSQRRFAEYLVSIIDDLDHIQQKYDGVVKTLLIRNWQCPVFNNDIFSGKLMMPIPPRGSVFDYVYAPLDGTGRWKTWVEILPKIDIAPGTLYSNIVVPNAYTAQYGFLLDLLLQRDKKVLVCGPTGTGKSVYVTKTISAFPQDKFKCLSLGFSAKTSANMTQDIVDGKLDKRRKGVYGPPMGQKAIIFVDDLNMPEVETYGAQPPIELLRQMIDSGGWYDLKEMTWKHIVDTVVVSAMGPPGGGRNHVTPRFMRHFNIMCFAEFDSPTLIRIFSTIVDWYFMGNKFSSEVQNAKNAVVAATLDTYK